MINYSPNPAEIVIPMVLPMMLPFVTVYPDKNDARDDGAGNNDKELGLELMRN